MRTLVLAALVLTPALGWGQTVTSYNGTVLVPGLQEDLTVWIQGHSTGNSALQAYNALVDLKGGYLPPNIPTSSSIQSQATVLRAFLDSVGPGKVLVAHSMGGLVSRSMYRSNPNGVAGLVTIASPHGGTFTANNSSYLVPYLQTTITRLNQAGIPLGIVVGTPVLGPVVGGIVGHQFAQYVLQFRDSINMNRSGFAGELVT